VRLVFPAKRPAAEKQSRAARRRSREARRRRFLLGGGALLSLVILGAWFPANALYHQHSSLASAEAQLNVLHQQDAALAQERKNLNDASEISRIAREQYQLVSPGQQAFEVLPKTGNSHAEAPYSGDPGLRGPEAPSSASVLPPGSGTTTTQPAKTTRAVAASQASKTSGAAPAAPSGGVVGRMVNALEFWR
jgi:cell division protein FtsB